MKLKGISAMAVSSMLCLQLAFSKTIPVDSLSEVIPDTLMGDRIANHIHKQLDEIADNVNFVHLEEQLAEPSLSGFVPTTVEGRLAYLQKAVPLTYNAEVQSYIDMYSTDRYRRHLSRMKGLGRYYFPIYERVFAEMGLPDEIKYLSIVESALDPHAVSRVGATGLWQFMYATARVYDLAMDSYIDERKDPVAASYAAAAYLLDAYREFGDWHLAIASYNCGKGNVLRAIERSGLQKPDYWEISRYLPRETRNYVPAFIAMTYMMEYHEEHGIRPEETDLDINTETVWVQRHVPFSGVAKALAVDESMLQMLNPAYKRGLVNGTPEFPKRLVLPEVKPSAYSALYAVLNEASSGKPAVLNASNRTNEETRRFAIVHQVRKGETLEKISRRYGVTVQDLRVWNNLEKNIIVPGQRLRVSDGEVRSGNDASNDGSYITYRVKKGDTLSGIAGNYRGATVSAIKAANGLKSNQIKPGMTLKIRVN